MLFLQQIPCPNLRQSKDEPICKTIYNLKRLSSQKSIEWCENYSKLNSNISVTKITFVINKQLIINKHLSKLSREVSLTLDWDRYHVWSLPKRLVSMTLFYLFTQPVLDKVCVLFPHLCPLGILFKTFCLFIKHKFEETFSVLSGEIFKHVFVRKLLLMSRLEEWKGFLLWQKLWFDVKGMWHVYEGAQHSSHYSTCFCWKLFFRRQTEHYYIYEPTSTRVESCHIAVNIFMQ